MLGLSAGIASAEKADKFKPAYIESDKMEHDDSNMVSVFSGRVVLTKGTLSLKGDRVELREDPKGFQFGVVTAASGGQVFYRQKREGVNEWMEGQANRIDYNGKADVVTLIGKAVVRRYVGTQLNDEFSGDLIVYDQPKDQFEVSSQGQATKGESRQSSERVRAVIAPKAKDTP